ncbi:MAG: polyphosphate polymerase domain-containing protein [Prevotella sp.]|nr:polyphosphate polymerase domain-containing protein [Prevotella sp.]
MEEILRHFDPITLNEMSGIRLMNRTDTKFVTTKPMLKRLLQMAANEYYAQDIDGQRMADYYTVYFDTPDCNMYTVHETGHTNRQKLRVRSYVDSNLNFLEVKTKNNKGRTKKKRVSLDDFNPEDNSEFSILDSQFSDFLHDNLHYDPQTLSRQLENRFKRITLVNKGKTERLTIDTNLNFHNLATNHHWQMGDAVIIELKRDGLVPSPILNMLRELRIKPHGFSKYVIGSALTNDQLHVNRLKPKLHYIKKILNI